MKAGRLLVSAGHFPVLSEQIQGRCPDGENTRASFISRQKLGRHQASEYVSRFEEMEKQGGVGLPVRIAGDIGRFRYVATDEMSDNV